MLVSNLDKTKQELSRHLLAKSKGDLTNGEILELCHAYHLLKQPDNPPVQINNHQLNKMIKG
ncbi:MAG: hypothetical protein IME94_07930 [Proteobacteria bacterium]|nr:hypothetical protein [Pseudomonadota bacterium]